MIPHEPKARALVAIAAAIVVAAACGGSVSTGSGADASVSDGAMADGAVGDATSADGAADAGGDANGDAHADTAADAPAALDAMPPDGGPPPVVACADADMVCTPPLSFCLDDKWLRYYSGGTCDDDAGTCSFVVNEMLCPPSGNPPDCFQGGCRMVVLR
jgi:hypothetical protein